jgi:flagellar biosynthesis GTPase FlhF
MEKIRDKVLAKINSLEHRDLKKGTFHKAIADYTQTLFETQQKEIERLKEMLEIEQTNSDELLSKVTQLKKQVEEAHSLLHKCNSSDANVDRANRISN